MPTRIRRSSDKLDVSGLIEFIYSVAEHGGWRERSELIKAYNAGIEWFINFDEEVQNAMQYLVEASVDQGYDNLPPIE